MERTVLNHMEAAAPRPPGDYLFFMEGHGRLRFRLVEDVPSGGSR